MKVWDVIKILHAGKNQFLNVQHCGDYSSWNPHKDEGWLSYRKAMSVIMNWKYPMLYRLLKMVGII